MVADKGEGMYVDDGGGNEDGEAIMKWGEVNRWMMMCAAEDDNDDGKWMDHVRRW